MDENLITPSDFFNHGRDLLEHGKYREALQYFEAAIEREYYDNDIHLPMGEALFEVGRFNDALEEFNKVETEDVATQAEVLLWKGSCFLELRKTRRAISAFNRVIELHPDHAEAHFKRGLALADMGSPERALEAFNSSEKLLRAVSGSSDNEALAEVLMWKGRVTTRLGRRQEGLELMFQAYETAPEHPGPYNEIADSFRLSGDLTSAEEWYKKGLERLPNDPSLHNDYGNLLRELGRYRDSLAHLTTAIERDANRAVAYYNRALTLERLELYDEALKDYDTVVESNPSDLDARMRKLDLLAQLGMFKEAHELLLALTDEERREPACQETASRLYNRQAARAEKDGDAGMALRMHKLCLDLHPDFLDVETPAPGDDRPEQRMDRLRALSQQVAKDDPLHGLSVLLHAATEYGLLRLSRREHAEPGAKTRAAQNKRARQVHELLQAALDAGVYPDLAHKLIAELAFYELKDETLALKHIDQAIAARADFVGALWVKAVVLAEARHDTEGAAECYRRILKITPNNPTILLSLGDLHFDAGQPHHALACYRHVLEERPGDVSVNRDIGHCYLALQRYGDAISTFARMDADGAMGLEIQLDLAEAHLCVGERGEAQNLVDRVLASNEGVDPNVEARAAELSAALALARHNPKQALKELKKVEETQLSTYGLLQRIKANVELGKFDDALEDANEVESLLPYHAPDSIEACYQMARVQFLRDQLPQALETLDDILQWSPLEQRAFRLKAWILKLQGKLEESDAVESERRFATEIAKVHRLLQYEDYPEALQGAQKLAADYPSRLEPLYYKACALAQTGDEEQALAVALQVAKGSPDLRGRMLDEYYLESLALRSRPEYLPTKEEIDQVLRDLKSNHEKGGQAG